MAPERASISIILGPTQVVLSSTTSDDFAQAPRPDADLWL
jgi:hypothetical protein